MKKLLYFLSLGVLAMTACSKDDDTLDQPTPEAPAVSQVTLDVTSDNPLLTMNGSNGSIRFKTNGGEVIIDVTTNQDGWSYTNSGESWLTATADAYFLTLSADRIAEEIDSADKAPTATVTITAGEGEEARTVTIEVSQNYYGQPEVSAGTTAVRLPAYGELSQQIVITTDQDEWTFDNEPCTWLLIEQTDGAIVLTADPNTTTEERTMTLTVTAGYGAASAEEKIVVSQDGTAYISLDTHAVAAEPAGGTQAIHITSNPELAWSYTTISDTAAIAAGEQGPNDPDWYTTSRDETTLYVTVKEDAKGESHTGDILITVGEKENVITTTVRVYQIGTSTEECIYEIYVDESVSGGMTVTDAPRGTGTMNYTGIACTVDWGDGSEPESFEGVQPVHTYKKPGFYTVVSKGSSTSMYFPAQTRRIISWGQFGITSAASMCVNCRVLTTVPNDIAGSFKEVTTFYQAFNYCTMEAIPEGLFSYATKATNFSSCFYYAGNVKEIPEDLFVNCTAAEDFTGCFYCCGTTTSGTNYSTVASTVDGLRESYEFFVEHAKIHEIPAGLFRNCVNAKKFNYALRGMGLKSVPEHLFDNCTEVTSFNTLFGECMLLETVPEDLFKYNTKVTDISQMFRYCYSIKTVPAKLFSYFSQTSGSGPTSLNYMFCLSGIEEVPANLLENLPLITAATYMFDGCSHLKSIDANFFAKQTNMGASGINYLFQRCENLKKIPEGLFKSLTKLTSFNYVFQYSGIEEIPADVFSYFTSTGAITFTYTFRSCKNIKKIPANLFEKATGTTGGFGNTFQESGIEEIPEGLFAKNTKANSFTSTFQGCENLKKLPKELFKGTVATSFSMTFNGCSGLTELPEDLFAYSPNVTMFSQTFRDCSSLKSLPAKLFAQNAKVTQFMSTFINCTSLTDVPLGLLDAPVNATTGAGLVTSVTGMFSGCTALKGLPVNFFAKQKNITNVSSLFDGCTGLTGESCYDQAEDGTKTHLYERTAAAGYKAPTSVSYCYRNCTGLSDYALSIPTNWK